MANPFLVLGGIAVGIITATFGVLQVPGWVSAAHDASVMNDLAGVKSAQASVGSVSGRYFASLDDPALDGSGLKLTTGASARSLEIFTTDGAWCAISESQSGAFFGASHTASSISKAATRVDALAAVQCGADGSPIGTGPESIAATAHNAPNMQNWASADRISWAPGGAVTLGGFRVLYQVDPDGRVWESPGAGHTAYAVTDDGLYYGINGDYPGYIVKNSWDKTGSPAVELLTPRVHTNLTHQSLFVSPNGTVYYGEMNASETELVIYRVESTLIETHRVPLVGDLFAFVQRGYPFTVNNDGTAVVVTGTTTGDPTVNIISATGTRTTHKLDPSKTWMPKAQVTHTGGYIVPALDHGNEVTTFLEGFPNGYTRTITMNVLVRDFDLGPGGEIAVISGDMYGSMLPTGELTVLGRIAG